MSLRAVGLGLPLTVAACTAVFHVDPVGLDERPRMLALDNTASKTDLVDFPVLVVLDGTRIPYESVADPTRELQFHDVVSGTNLPYEVDHWDPGGTSDVWVRVPRIPAAMRTDQIVMTFGSGASGPGAGEVWTGYDLVVHAERDAGDSAGSDQGGALAGATLGSGMIGNGLSLASETARVTFGTGAALLDGWSQFSLELAIRPDYPDLGLCAGTRPNTPLRTVVAQAGMNDWGPLLGSFTCASGTGPLLTSLGVRTATNGNIGADLYMPNHVWTDVLVTYDGTTLWAYRNGTVAAVDGTGASDALYHATGPIVLGAETGGMIGALDEIRVSRTFRSRDWAYAQYLTIANQFVTITPIGAP